MGLFSKKGCAVCGEKAGLGSKSLTDGELCKDCRKKLSPWFEEYKGSSSEDIRAQIEAREENKKALEDFKVTKAWGIKKYATAMQFIYDQDQKCFVVVEGPEETFRDRNPDIIRFDQVRNIWLEVDEGWSESGDQYAPKSNRILTQDKYDEVFWRYDFYLNFALDHPYLKQIRYPMNFKTTVIQVPQRFFLFKRGLELAGEYQREEIAYQADRLEAMAGKEDAFIRLGKYSDIIRLKYSEQSIPEHLVQDVKNDLYLKKIENVAGHVRRADRISRLILGK
ncbi:MAG: DUF4428 domain-containing protein [Firmicutes bacterium]|nr:DUF4428 domain-containing protein [Bacillota bacterium]